MAVIYHNEFKVPTLNADIKGNLPALNGRIWYHNIEHRLKFKGDGKNVTLVGLEEISSPEGASLIGIEGVPRLGKNLQEVIVNFQKAMDNLKGNIKWRPAVDKNIHYIKLGESELDLEEIKDFKIGERLLDLSNKKIYVAKKNGWSKGITVKNGESFLFKDAGIGKSSDDGVISSPTNKIYKGSILIELDLCEGYTCRVIEEKCVYTFCNTEWVRSFDIGSHDFLMGVYGGDSDGCYHLSKDEINLVKTILKEEQEGNRVKFFNSGPVVLKNPDKVVHRLGTRYVQLTILEDNNGEPGVNVSSKYSYFTINKDEIRISGLYGRFWIYVVGA